MSCFSRVLAASFFVLSSSGCYAGGECGSDCERGVFNSCTCGADDPCGWAGDGHCDADSCASVADELFDDSLDCGACNGECSALRYTACTCGADDLCRWAGDGACDREGCEAVAGVLGYDDTQDCHGVSSELTFGVTTVFDDLDVGDFQIIDSGLAALGYGRVLRDRDVTASGLAGYLARDITTLYHTGHGFEEGLSTSEGVLSVNQIELGVRHAVIAACFALASSWAGCFGPTTESVLGYHLVSFDLLDDAVAELFLESLGRGSGYPEAWYLANSAVEEVADRWIIYARLGGSIVEYSARRERIPMSRGTAELVALGRSGRIRVSSELLDSQEGLEAARGAPEVRVVEGARAASDFLAGGWASLAESVIEGEEAIARARGFAEEELGGIPVDAEVDWVRAVIATREGSASRQVAQMVRFHRVIEGYPISGNLITDHITLLVTGDGVAAWSMFWPRISVEPGSAVAPPVISVGEAIAAAAEELDRSVKGELRIVASRAVLGTLGAGRGVRRLVPAYQLIGADGYPSVTLDASTGHPLR